MSDWPARLLLFGGTGDLAARSLYPALAALAEDGRLPDPFHVLATGSRDQTDDEFHDRVAESLEEHAGDAGEAARRRILETVRYQQADIASADDLAALVESLPGEGPLLAYLAVPPGTFADAIRGLHAAGLPEGSRLVIEKPFGEGLESAQELNALIHERFDESQVFRVDHFLAKQTVHNVLGLRFANRLFEPVWTNQHIERVEITFDETLALEGRAAYYDGTGALVDMLQNHLLQLLCLVAMDPPSSLEGDDLRDRKVSVLRAARALPEESVRARYRGYVDEEGVDPSLDTETFASITLSIDSWRWAGVPFVLRSGKALGEDRREIAIHFKPVPHLAFGERTRPGPNVVRLQLGPDRLSIGLSMNGDGELFDVSPIELDTELRPPDLPAYANVLVHAFDGNPTFSIRDDEAEEAWRVIEPIRAAWREGAVPMQEYDVGSDGP
ncbi:MAG TPA: glucose-6-phosphate dehydrogenase [Acidimicrobiales bacterium]|nr:glucose-6-phosphate dehydrogenase [Acidimicrobiales bacterium]